MSPVVDGHHHIWRQADLPWLAGPMQPRIFGPYEPIRRDYPIEEFLADIAGSGVAKSVYVQTNWAPEAYEDEAAWVQRTADRTGWPHAIVAYADFSAEDVRPQLDRLSRYPLVRGARMQLHWHENPQYRFAARRDLVADPRIRRNIGYLADYGLSFDLQVFAPQMAGRSRTWRRLVRRSPSCCSTPACLRTFRPPDGRNGAREWCAWAPAPTWSPSSPGSAPSCIAMTLSMSPTWSARPSGSSAPAGACSDRTFRSRSCGPPMARLSRPSATPSPRFTPKEQQAILHDTAMRVYRIAP